MGILAITEGGPLIDCSICGKRECDYETGIACKVCEAVHCSKCVKEVQNRGDYSPDADYVDGRWRDVSVWRGCLACRKAA